MLHFEIPYLLLLCLLSVYGAHRLWLAIEGAWRSRRPERPRRELTPELADSQVLVQLPVYNDGEVFPRLLDSLSRLDWPRDRLEVQVLDDSDDGSSVGIARRIEQLRKNGLRVEHLRRPDRVGFKAGALSEGLELTCAPFVALFDSDFVIPPDFLRRAIPEFADTRIALVQGRWVYLNEERNLLTRIQALMLEAHFALEHRTRARAGRFFNFNGTAGVWRRAAIDDAGGWRADTITEDLDLSLRAWLGGWRFVYRDDLEVPCEVPEQMSAFRTQQNRWVAGTMQTTFSALPRILSAPMPFLSRLDLLIGLTGNLCYPLIVVLALSLPHAIAIRLAERDVLILHADIPFFFFATGSVAFFYFRARRQRSSREMLLRIPALMALGLGMTLHNSRAVLRGLSGGARIFERTPKRGGGRRRSREFLPWLEVGMLLYLVTIGLYASKVALFSLPLVGLLAIGYAMVIFSGRGPGEGEESAQGDSSQASE